MSTASFDDANENKMDICDGNIFKSTANGLYCWIDSPQLYELILPDKFVFDFDIYVLHMNNTYKYSFVAHFDEIKSIYNIAHKNKMKYFCSQTFPKGITNRLHNESMNRMEKYMVLPNNIETDATLFISDYLHNCKPDDILIQKHDLSNIIDLVDIFMDDTPNLHYICKPPKKHWLGKTRKPTKYDCYALCHILRILFNSPSFVLQDYLYKHLIISIEMKDKLQRIANEWINELSIKLKYARIKDKNDKQHSYLKLCTDRRYKYMKFNMMIAVKEPNASITHWSLKFIGKDHLLTMDWRTDSSVSIELLNNNTIQQRIFWFSWRSQLKSKEKLTFSKRYQRITNKIGLGEYYITGNDIAHLVTKWLAQNPIYNGISNNCQHFIRDFISIFDENEANKLSYINASNHAVYLSPFAGVQNAKIHSKGIYEIMGMLRDELVKCRDLRESKTKKLRQFLTNVKLQKYYHILVTHGFYDEDYHMIDDDHLKLIKMRNKNDRDRFLLYKPFYLKEFLIDIKLDKYGYYNKFISKGYNNDDLYGLSNLSLDVLNKEINMKLAHCQRFLALIELKAWLVNMVKLPQYFHVFTDNGFDSMERIDNLTKEILKQIGMDIEHQRIIMKYVKTEDDVKKTSFDDVIICNPTDDPIEEEKKDVLDMNGQQLLEYWGLSRYIAKMIDEELINPSDWQYLTVDDLKQDFRFKSFDARKFMAKYQDWMKLKQER